MTNLIQANKVARVTPRDEEGTEFAFFGILIGAEQASTALAIVDLDGNTVTWNDGELVAGVVYPIAGTRINETGTGATIVTIFGA